MKTKVFWGIKNKHFSIVLLGCISLVLLSFVILPKMVSADATITLNDALTVIDGTGASLNGNDVDITSNGTYTISGTSTDGMVHVLLDVADTNQVILNLNGVSLTNSDYSAIYIENATGGVVINLASGTTNILNDGASTTKATLYGKAQPLEINGPGTLTINSVGSAGSTHSIKNAGDLTINSGTFNLTHDHSDGIHVEGTGGVGNIIINGGTINIEDTGIDTSGDLGANDTDGIDSKGYINITGGDFNISTGNNGIKSTGNLTIDGADTYINITEATEGIESKGGIITINDGLIEILSSDDGINASLNSTGDIYINGGMIYINSSANDGIDANGNIYISGGTIVSLGWGDSISPDSGFDVGDDDNSNGIEVFVITGGTIVGTGGDLLYAIPSSTLSTQNSVLFDSITSGLILRVQDGDSDVLTFEIPRVYQKMVFSSPNLLSGTTYTIYKGGTMEEGEEFHGLYTGSTYSGGTETRTFTISSCVTNVLNAGVVVNNVSPSVSAGTDKSIRLPTNEVALTSTATDSDGTITGVLWSYVSGPSTYSIESPTSLSTEITGLTTAGTYVFKLTATDNDEATASDNISVIVRNKSSGSGGGGGGSSHSSSSGNSNNTTVPLISITAEQQLTATIINFTRNLKQGLRGDDVKQLQDFLNNKGHNCGIADGIFGPKTKQAVISFQLVNKLLGDGIVGPITVSFIK